MKKIILTLSTIMFVSLNLVGCSNSKDLTYSIKANQEIEVGDEIPSGKYKAQILSEYNSDISISIIEFKEPYLQYGEELVGDLIKEESNMSTYVYEVELPKGKLVSSNVDVLLTKLN